MLIELSFFIKQICAIHYGMMCPHSEAIMDSIEWHLKYNTKLTISWHKLVAMAIYEVHYGPSTMSQGKTPEVK